MRNIMASVLLAVIASACGDDDPSGPSSNVDGLRLEAQVAQLTSGSAFFSAVVTVTNTTGVSITRNLSLACPIGIQLLAVQGGASVYDESERECGATTNAVTIAAGQSVTLTSGTRYIPTLLETVSPNTYRARALVRFEAGDIALVEAGTFRLPACRAEGIGTTCD